MKDNRNLGKYDLNVLLRNPMLIHRIQDAFMELKDESLFAESIRKNAKDKPRECISMVVAQYKDNPKLIRKIVGNEVLQLIQEYLCKEFITDLDDIID